MPPHRIGTCHVTSPIPVAAAVRLRALNAGTAACLAAGILRNLAEVQGILNQLLSTFRSPDEVTARCGRNSKELCRGRGVPRMTRRKTGGPSGLLYRLRIDRRAGRARNHRRWAAAEELAGAVPRASAGSFQRRRSNRLLT